jgi:hypothetical protein
MKLYTITIAVYEVHVGITAMLCEIHTYFLSMPISYLIVWELIIVFKN